MMVSDLDIYRAAHLLIKQHRDEAPVHAAMRGAISRRSTDCKTTGSTKC